MAKFIYQNGQFEAVDTKKELAYTDYKIIKNNVDAEYVEKDGTIKSTKHDGYEIKEVILYKQPMKADEVYYIIEINGSMYNCIPENNDTIYSTYKEARINLMEQQRNMTDNIQLRQQI